MSHKTDFCILGAGLAGLSLADALQNSNISVTIIDKHDLASGASGTPGGLVNPATGRRATKAWKAESCYEAVFENLQKIQAQSSNSFYQRSGLLRPALLEKMARKMKDQYDNTTWPAGWCQWKSEREIKDIHPGIKCVNGGLWLPIGLSVDVGSYIQAYASYLMDQDVPVFLNEKPKVIKEHKGWNLEMETTSISCSHLVYATGHSTGNSSFWDWLPLNLIKGQVAKFKTRHTPLSFSHSISSLGYIAQTGEDNVFVQGSTYEHDFNHIQADQEGEQYLRKRMRRTLPQLEKRVTISDQWAGVRTSTPDYKPILGKHPEHNNLHVFTGLGSKGLLYSKFLANHYTDHLIKKTSLFPEISIKRL